MRVWIINQNAYTPGQSAGTRHYSLGQELRRLGHEPLVITTSFYHKAKQETRLAKGEKWKLEDVDGLPFLWLRTPPYKGNSLKRVLNWAAFANAVIRQRGLRELSRPDVIVGSSPPISGAWAALVLAKRIGVPFVFEVRDIWPLTLVECGGISPRNPLIMWMSHVERRLAREADAVVSVLPQSQSYLESIGMPSGRFSWIPNGIRAEEWDRGEHPLPDEHQAAFVGCRQRGDFVVLYIGAQGRANALDQVPLLSSVHRGSPPYHIIMIGDGVERDSLVAEVRKRRLSFITMLPRITKDQARTAMALTDACLFSLRPDPLFRFGISSNKLFDYMMAGKPIVFASHAGNNPVEDASCGVSVAPYDPKGLDAAIRSLMEFGPQDRQAMGRRGREYVLHEHEWSKLGRRYESLLSSVARTAGPKSATGGS